MSPPCDARVGRWLGIGLAAVEASRARSVERGQSRCDCPGVTARGRVSVGDTLCKTECANGTKVWCCLHLDGTVSLVMNKPEKDRGPQIVFSNNPKVLSCKFPLVTTWVL